MVRKKQVEDVFFTGRYLQRGKEVSYRCIFLNSEDKKHL